MPVHGGDIYKNQVNIDFSVNLSPYGMPPKVRASLNRSMLKLSCYPDLEYREVREAIGKMEGVDAANIVVGNGASELIYALLRALKRLGGLNSVGLINPCFSEYERAAMMAGFSIEEKYLKEAEDFRWNEDVLNTLLDMSDIVFLGNPNNPTGMKLPADWILKVVPLLEEKKKVMILDESFLPLTSGYEAGGLVKSKSLIYIRSFTKSMAMPGIRMGYLMSFDEKIVKAVWDELPEWNVSIPSMYTGIEASSSMNYLKKNVDDPVNGIDSLREFLKEGLEKRGVKVFSSDTSFLLIKSDEKLYVRLLSKKILIRKCESFKGLNESFYRIAVKSKDESMKLLDAIDGFIGDCFDDAKYINDSELASPKLMHVLPEDIERTSFSIISNELEEKGIVLDDRTKNVVKRCIHTSADFEYADSLRFSDGAIDTAKKLIRKGAHIVTDTNMALAGINKGELAKYGCKIDCYMADPEIIKNAKACGKTRASVSMEHAAGLGDNTIFVIGNAPTALVSLCDLMDNEGYKPGLIIGVPVGFVNVENAKDMVMEREVPYIVNKGRKGGSNIAACIVNAILYEMREENG